MKKMLIFIAIFSSLPILIILPEQGVYRRIQDLKIKAVVEGIKRFGTKVWADTAEPQEVKKAGELGAEGGTSNPSLVAQAIQKNPEIYRKRISELVEKYNQSSSYIMDRLQEIEKIHDRAKVETDPLVKAVLLELTADLIENGLKNFSGPMSWEVDPRFHDNAYAMVEEARLIYEIAEERGLDTHRIYIKIPATEAGMSATEQLISIGINVNLTLVFSIAQGLEGLRRYELAIDKAEERGLNCNEIYLCISPFLGRWDDYLPKLGLNVVDENNNPVAGLYFAKLLHYRLLREIEEGDYSFKVRPEIIMASIRSINHVQQLIGSDILTIPPGVLFKPEFATIDTSMPTVNEPIDRNLVNQLLKNDLFRISMLDINEGGITIRQFDAHPLVVEGNNKFIKPYEELLDLINNILSNKP